MSEFNVPALVSETFQYGGQKVTLETGVMARQATGAVMVRMGETVVFVTVVGVPNSDEGRDFFPLTVEYQEKTYAAGKIPGGFFKREGRPAVDEILTARLMDRPIRPLFPKGFMNEVQIVATVLSLDPEIAPDIPAMLGASAALAISGIPFNGPIAAARVGYSQGKFSLNPTASYLKESSLDLVVAGTKSAVLMVESEANQLPEETMLDAVMFGHENMQLAINAIQSLAQKAAKPAWDWQAPEKDTALFDKVFQIAEKELRQAYGLSEKQTRYARIADIKSATCEQLNAGAEGAPSKDDITKFVSEIEKNIVRGDILAGKPRIDGRDTKTVRPLFMQLGTLPRAHGSALFTRGETQALAVTTLGTGRDAQVIDAIAGERKDHFMVHYNFPPYCVGEAGRVGAPKRREIGHGALARRSLNAIIPSEEEFPYVIRLVSEIMESNGSSSMASVCGGCLSLMDAGVPVKAPVAGIAMGLIKEGEQYAVLTDILGDEDHLGDMDFKVAGTTDGVTALQMDIKIDGITKEIMQKALQQAKDARLHILSQMQKVIQAPRSDLSAHAPRIISFSVNPEKIRDIIGKGGATIRRITEETGVTIDIDDDGTVKIASVDKAASDEARRQIELIIEEVELGKIYEGTVVKVVDFGAFVAVLPGKEGLVHISQIADERINDINAVLKEGQSVFVKVMEIDRQGKVRLSMKEARRQMQPMQ